MKTWKYIFGPLIILIMTVTGCGLTANQLARPIQQTPVVRGDLTTKINCSGKIAVVTDAKLSFSGSGQLTTLAVKEGDTVTRGHVLAKLDSSSLELSLSKARVDQGIARLGLIQAQAGLDRAKLAQVQSNSILTGAQFNLDRTDAVKDIQDEISKLQRQIEVSKQMMAERIALNSEEAVTYYLSQINTAEGELRNAQKNLTDLLTGSETGPVMAGVATYKTGSQEYDRLVVEDARAKEVAFEAAQKAVDQTAVEIAVAQKTIDQANDSISLAQKNIDYWQQQINNATLIAPFDGVIAKLYYKQGDIIPSPLAAPQVIIYLVDNATLEVDVNIDELDAPAVKTGQLAVINIDALPGTSLQGKVTEISVIPNAQATASGTSAYVAKITFSVLPGSAVKTGMNASVHITSQQLNNVLLLPNDAVKRDKQGKTYVKVMQNQVITNQPVVIGARSGTVTQIVSGLKEGDQAVIGVAWSLQ